MGRRTSCVVEALDLQQVPSAPIIVNAFELRSQNCESDCRLCHVCLSVRPSVRMEHLGYHWTGFDKI